MTAHTPGPFVVHPLNAWIMCSQLDEEGQPTPVAALAYPTAYRSEAETRANGDLFAAAPSLLAALEGLVPADFDEHPDDYADDWHVARAAIRLARGEAA